MSEVDGPVAAGPLVGLRVLNRGCRLPALYCARLLADLGATVVSTARPETAGSGLLAGQHRYLALNTRTLALTTDTDVEAARQWADVVIEEVGAGRESGDGDRAGCVRRPDQVRVLISDFGLSGPRATWRGSDLVDSAYGGGCQQNGEPGRPPLRAPAGITEMQVGLNAAVGVVVAAIVLRRTGAGQDIEISGVDCWATVQTAIGTLEYIFLGRVAQRAGRRFAGRGYPYTILPCKDGDVRLIALVGREWARAVEMMGNPSWAADPRYANRLKNQELYADELDELVGAWLAERTQTEVLDAALRFRVPWAPVKRVRDLLDDPHLQHQGLFVDDGGVRVPGPVAKFGGRRPQVRHGSAAEPVRVGDIGAGGQDVPFRTAAADEAPADALPLAGIRIVDFGWAWAGGVVGSVLADFGAEVIKVESSRRMEPMRFDRPIIDDGNDAYEKGGLHHNVNRNKRSISVDVTTEDGSRIVRELVASSDVLIENLSPGALTGRGLGADALCEQNPSLVYLSLSAVGRDGPYAGIRAYAPVLTALAGVDAITGYPDEPALGLQQGLADPNAGLHGALAVLAALYARFGTGLGGHVEVSQLDALIALIGGHVAALQAGVADVPIGNLDRDGAPSGVYPTTGDDKWVAISCQSDDDWRCLRAALGEPSWAKHPGFDTAAGRWARRDEIDAAIAAWTISRNRWEVAETLQASGVAAAPLLDTGDRFSDDHLQARQVYVAVDHPLTGTEFLCGLPWKLGATPGSVRTPAPLLGQHTVEVLRDVLGYDDATIQDLRDRGVLV